MTIDRSTLIEARSVTKTYTRGRWYSACGVRALDNVTLSIQRASTVALVGPSGSGKSTLARCVAQLEKPDVGEIWFEGRDLASFTQAALRHLRSGIQMVPQNPSASLNPHWTAAQIVAEPLCVQKWGNAKERWLRSLKLVESVGLDEGTLHQRPYQLSGGQRTRLALARALALEPKLLILDESLASLDVSLQAQIINLLIDLQTSLGVAYLVIAHDMTLVASMTDQVVELRKGQIVRQEVLAC
jgi:peptide/nickel transport system ATP-binding protein